MSSGPSFTESDVGRLLRAHGEQQEMFAVQAEQLLESRTMHAECLESTRHLETKIDKLITVCEEQETRLGDLEEAQQADDTLREGVTTGAKIARWAFSLAFGALVGALGTVGASHLDHRDRINRLETQGVAATRAIERHEEEDEREHRVSATARQEVRDDVQATLEAIRQMQRQQTAQKDDVDSALRELRSEVARLRRTYR